MTDVRKQRWRRAGRWSLLGAAWLGVLMLAAVVWFKTVFPGWAGTQIQRQLVGMGFSVADVLVESCSLSGVTLAPVRVGTSDGRWLAAESARLRFTPGGLLQHRLDGVTVSGLTLEVVRTGEGWRVPVLVPLLPTAGAKATPAAADTPMPRPAAADSAWECNSLELHGCRVEVINGTATVPLTVEVAVSAPVGSPVLASGELVTGTSRVNFRSRLTRDGRSGVCQVRIPEASVREVLAILEQTAVLPKPAVAVDATVRGAAQGRWRDGHVLAASVSLAADDLAVALPSRGANARGGLDAQARWEPAAGTLAVKLTGWLFELATPALTVPAAGTERAMQLQVTGELALPSLARSAPGLRLAGSVDLAPALLTALAPAPLDLTAERCRIEFAAAVEPVLEGAAGWRWRASTAAPVCLPAVLASVPPALLMGDISLTADAAGRTDTGEVAGNLEARLLALDGWLPGTAFGASECALMAGFSLTSGRLTVSGFTTLDEGWLEHGSGLQLRGIRALMPVGWDSQQGLGAPVLPDADLGPSGSVTIDAARFGALLGHGTITTLWDGPGRLAVAAAFGGEGLPDVTATGTMATGVTPALAATFALAPWSFTQQSPALALAGRLPPDLVAAGVLTASGTCRLDGMGFHGTLTAGLKDGTIALPKQELRVTGIQAALSLPALPALTSAPHQQLSFTSASVMGMPFDSGSVVLQMEAPDRWFVEQATTGWCGGVLRTYALGIDFSGDDYDMVIFADRVELPRLLALVKGFDGTAAGTLYGRLPLRIRKGRAYFQDGFLYAVPGQPGFVAIKDASMITGALAQAGTDPQTLKRVGAALQDLGFSMFKVDLAGEGAKDAVLRFHLAGASRKDPALPPVDLTFNVHGPLGQLLNLGIRLQSMSGKAASERK